MTSSGLNIDMRSEPPNGPTTSEGSDREPDRRRAVETEACSLASLKMPPHELGLAGERNNGTTLKDGTRVCE
jgi:hypothetical protein